MRIPLFFVTGVLSVSALSACQPPEDTAPAEVVKVPIEIEPAERGTIHERAALNGEVRAQDHSRLASGGAGKIDAVYVDEGDRVKKGQMLVKVAGNLASARLKQANAGLKSAQSAHGRVAALAAKNMASNAALEQAETALAGAEAQSAMAQVAYNDAMVRAPHSGIIAHVSVSTGEQAMPGMPLVEVVDLRTVEVIAHIAERDAPLFELGREASIEIDAYPDQPMTGRVSRVGIVADTHSRTFELELAVDNLDQKLKPGMLVRAKLIRQTTEDVIVVRRDAVVEELDGRVVFVEESGLAKRIAVTIGATEGDRVAILSGLEPGQRVVIVGQRSLVDKQPVTVVTEHSISKAVAEQRPARASDDAQ